MIFIARYFRYDFD